MILIVLGLAFLVWGLSSALLDWMFNTPVRKSQTPKYKSKIKW